MKTAVSVPVSSPWSGGGSPFAINSKKFGMWLFIVSDTLTFSALLLAYSYSRLANPNWPRPFEIYPAIAKSTSMTLILLASSLTMVLGVAAAHRNDRAKTVRWLLLTALGGLAFAVAPNVERQSQTSVFVDDFLDRLFKCDLCPFLRWQSKDTFGNSAHLSP